VTGYDAASGMVTIDNQWGSRADHAVDVRQLYLSTQHPTISASTLEQDAEWNRAHADTEQQGWAELEALRIRNRYGQLSNAEYYHSIINTMRRLETTWQRHERTGDVDAGARDRARQRYQLMFNMILARDPVSAANIDLQVRQAAPRPTLYSAVDSQLQGG